MALIGSKLGPYEIIEEIGKGGMATVYRAFQPSIGRFVALKVIHRAIAADSNSLGRFQREARLIARLEHPHLLPVYDYDGEHDPPYIVMRYLEGSTLREALETGPIPLADTVHVLRQIGAALDYAHRQGVIHRDLKPSNVMIDTEGNAFLMDFGIARILESTDGLTQTGFAVGTPSYMSPEQGMGLTTVDNRSDIYALGVLLFQMLTGEPPFSGDNPMAIILQHINTPPPAASLVKGELPQAVDDVIRKAMAKEPDDRYQTATAMAVDLARAATLKPDSVPTQIKESAQRAVNAILASREARKDELDATMASFEALRVRELAARSAASRDLEGATIVKAAELPTVGAGRTPRLMTIALGAALIILVGLIALLLRTNGMSLDSALTAPPELTLSAEAGTASALADTRAAALIAQAQPSLSPTTAASQTPRPTHTPSSTLTLTATPTATLTPTPTATLTLTATPTATLTPTPTATFTPTPTATPATPVAVVRRDLTVRAGPGTNYPAVETISANTQVEIIGISDDGSWFQVTLEDGRSAWLSASVTLIDVAGDVASAPVAQAPTATATETPTATATDTWTPTPTATATFTSTPTPSATPTATATPDITLTPTTAPTPTPTATNTPVPASTFTPSPIPTFGPTPTATPTPTPLPPGLMPFVADFQQPNALLGWDYAPDAWYVVDDAGEGILVGQGLLRQPLRILSQEAPEWRAPSPAGLVISFRVNMDAQAAGARVLFRYTDQGYYALEVFPGLMILRRSALAPDALARENERIIRQLSVPVSANQWHSVTIWIEGSRIFVYVDWQLQITAEDLTQPPLNSGDIWLQTNSTTRPVRFDDIAVRRAELASQHFQGPTLPSAWLPIDDARVTVAQESGGNQYVRMQGPGTLRPSTLPIRDLSMSCRLLSLEGGFQLRLRVNPGGAMLFDFAQGNLTIVQLDAIGNAIRQETIRNAYSRGQWENWQFDFVRSRLGVYRNGAVRYEGILNPPPGAGTIEFTAQAGDVFGIDDCLITETVASSNIDARIFLTVRAAIEQRSFSRLRSDFDEDFDDIFRTDDWWVDGQNAAGVFVIDPASSEHTNFLRMTDLGRPTWRLIRDVIGFGVFGEGGDLRSFTDSTDVQVTVLVRFPDGATGSAWLAARTTPNISGSNLDGYRLELRRDVEGSVQVVIRAILPTESLIIYEGALPGSDTNTDVPDWMLLEIVAYRDGIGFFANGVFLTSVNQVTLLGGTVALGVEPGTTADFDTLRIRDVTPR
jgi:serine/threonine-protein kinase